jgi:hypothetical protein
MIIRIKVIGSDRDYYLTGFDSITGEIEFSSYRDDALQYMQEHIAVQAMDSCMRGTYDNPTSFEIVKCD